MENRCNGWDLMDYEKSKKKYIYTRVDHFLHFFSTILFHAVNDHIETDSGEYIYIYILRVGAQGVGAHRGYLLVLDFFKKCIYIQGRRTWTCVQASRIFTASLEYRAVDHRAFQHLSPQPAPPAPPPSITRSPPSLSCKPPPSSNWCAFVFVSGVMDFSRAAHPLAHFGSPAALRTAAVKLYL